MKAEGIERKVYFNRYVRKNTLCLLIALSLLTINSCKDDDDDDDSSQAEGCVMIHYTNTYSGTESPTVTYTNTSDIVYAYDDQGNETGFTVKHDYVYSDGTTASYSGSNNYQYDSEGFRIRTVSQSNRTERDKSTSFSSYNTEYTYENKRLIKSTSEDSSNGGPKSISSYLYEYNSDGNLTKFTNVNYNEVMTIDYNGKSIQKITKVDAKGTSTSPFFEYNSKGLIVKWIETHETHTEEYRFEYDVNGQVTRQERIINGKKNYASVSEYDTKQSIYAKKDPRPKGHPVIPGFYPDVVYKNNVVRAMYYDGNAEGTAWELTGSSVHVYNYNASGFPVSSTAKGFDKNGAPTNTSSATYEYKDCQ
jgi:YD repeat-containing protein